MTVLDFPETTTATGLNERVRAGQQVADGLEERLGAKHEAALLALGRRVVGRYESLTSGLSAGISDPANPQPLPQELVLPEDAAAVEARAQAQRRAIAAAMLAAILGEAPDDIVRALVEQQAGRQAERLLEGARDRAAKVMLDSLLDGWSVPETSEALREEFRVFSRSQATMLARTDLISLSNGASTAAASLLGEAAPPFKTWLATEDSRTRPDHEEADGQTVPLDGVFGVFEVGGESLAYPGDPAGSDRNCINCRCTVVYSDVAVTAAYNANQPRDPGGEGGGQWVEDGASDEPETASTSIGGSELRRILSPEIAKESINVYWDDTVDERGFVQGWEMKPRDQWRSFRPNEPHVYADAWPQEYVGWKELHGDVPIMLDTSPENPRVGGLDTAVKRWIVGEGRETREGRPFPWFREIRAEYAFQEGMPPPLEQDSASQHTNGLPSGLKVEQSVLALRKGLAAAPAAQPALWRGTGNQEDSEWTRTVASAKPGDTLRMLPASYSRDPEKAMAYAGAYGEKQGVMIYVEPGSRGIADKKRFLHDEEVVTAGDFDVVGSEDVEIPENARRAGEQSSRRLRVVTVRQRPLGAAVTSALLIEGDLSTYPGRLLVEGEAGLSERPSNVEEEEMIESLTVNGLQFVPQEFVDEGKPDIHEPGFVASSAPLAPPDEWLQDPQLDAPTPLTVTPEGRVYGHLAEWGKCHTGINGTCVMAPRSRSNYEHFHTGGLMTASGETVRVGKITASPPGMRGGHANLSLDAAATVEHYDRSCAVAALVRAGEDRFGPWLAGVVRSDATPEQIAELRANPPSGDWRLKDGALDLVAALAVPVPGFPVAAVAASGEYQGEVTALVMGFEDDGPLALAASCGYDESELEELVEEALRVGLSEREIRLRTLQAAAWNEAAHRRQKATGRDNKESPADGGKFAPKEGGAGAPSSSKLEELKPGEKLTVTDKDGKKWKVGKGQVKTNEGTVWRYRIYPVGATDVANATIGLGKGSADPAKAASSAATALKRHLGTTEKTAGKRFEKKNPGSRAPTSAPR